MKKLISSHILTFFFLVYFHSFLHAQNGHNSVLFNDGWAFYKGDIDSKEDKNNIKWRAISIPHDFSIEGPFSQEWASGTGFAPGGIGWYRKKFRLVDQGAKQTFIYFDGVYQNSEVWINGHHLGKRPSGVVPFQYELSQYLKPNMENEILVRVDHSKFADSRWYTGTGIYRNVYLITTNRVHIDLWGVAFTTPSINLKTAEAEVDVSVINNSKSTTTVLIKCNLIDAKGTQVATENGQMNVRTDSTVTAKLKFNVKNPTLWSVENPYLYKLLVTVSQGGKIVDKWEERVGFRDIRFDPNDGFFLNGRNMKLKGACIHDDAGVLGVAVPKEVWQRRLKIMQEAGVNSVRMAHNPHADYLYDLCDEMGILVMDENFDEWEHGKNKWIAGWNKGKPGKDGPHEYFKEWSVRDISDMVRRNRNHASIIMWSIGNEIDYPGDPYIDPEKTPTPEHPSAARLGEVSKQMVDAIKLHDKSRPVTSALAGVEMSNKTTYPENLDIVGYNYQEWRYEKDHKTYPNRVIYGSENSKKLEAWLAVEKNKFISGLYLWTGIDHLGEAHNWPVHGSKNGMLDLACFPKAEYYFRQSLWLEKPMIQIVSADVPDAKNQDPYPKEGYPNWNYAAGDKKRINCFTNCPEAELFLNGVSLGKKKRGDFENRVISWDIDYKPGQLTAKGYTTDGKIISSTLKTANAAYAVNATADTPVLDKKTTTANVVINIVDKDGITVFNAANPITVTVNGPAKLLGLENGALDNMDDYRSPTKNLLNGKLLAYIQRVEGTGPIRVTIKTPGIKPQTLVFQSNKK